MTIQEKVRLAPLTTLQVGGAARYFAEARRDDEVREAVEYYYNRNSTFDNATVTVTK